MPVGNASGGFVELTHEFPFFFRALLIESSPSSFSLFAASISQLGLELMDRVGHVDELIVTGSVSLIFVLLGLVWLFAPELNAQVIATVEYIDGMLIFAPLATSSRDIEIA
mmetsp:Transcript_36416/g.92804  ORF Transcript_36416/g.92804 Transcript_36416/m.92804 type:complete len:111 (-) Transcript_36416:1778-2110(-)